MFLLSIIQFLNIHFKMKTLLHLLWVLLLFSCFQSELVELESDPDYQPKLVANIILNQHGEIQYQITKSRPINQFEHTDVLFMSEEKRDSILENVKVENANIKLFQDEVLVWETTTSNPQLQTFKIPQFNSEGNWNIKVSADGFDETVSTFEQFPAVLKSSFVDSIRLHDDAYQFTFQIDSGAENEYFLFESDDLSTNAYSCNFSLWLEYTVIENNCFKNNNIRLMPYVSLRNLEFDYVTTNYKTSILSISKSYYDYLSFAEDEDRIFSELADPRLSTTNMSNQLGIFALVNEDKYEFEIR